MPKHASLYYFVTISYGNVTVIYRSRAKVLGHPAQRAVMAAAVTAFSAAYPAFTAQSSRHGHASDDGGTQGEDYNQLV